MTKVAFQGVAGAYSEEAVRQYYGDAVESVPRNSFEEIFVAVEDGDADFALLPVENASAGSVAGALELLLERDLRVNAEVMLHVHHMLLVAPGTKREDIKRVRSHPQALAQCQRYMERYELVPEPAFDTAGSARDLATNPDGETAVIASKLAGEMYGLEMIDSTIEDYPFNYTRFLALGMDDPPRAQRNKTSIVFSSRNRAGALHNCLGVFASRGINLTGLVSRPRLNQPWRYTFYLDFEGHSKDRICQAALSDLMHSASFVKFLGSYPMATTPTVETRYVDGK